MIPFDYHDVVLAAAAPLAPTEREAFLHRVERDLLACSELGPGTVHRVVMAAQQAYFDPPDFSRFNGGSKYRR